MPPRCKAPKCAERANTCACPNPWTEFVSKNASGGKKTRAQHSAAYAALKATGAFNVQPGLNNGGCKSDPIKLCAWKIRRKAGHKDVVAKALETGERKKVNSEIAGFVGGLARPQREAKMRRFLIDVLKRDATIINADGEATLCDRLTRYLKLNTKDCKIIKFLGAGGSGIAFLGQRGGAKVVIKVAPLANDNARRDLDREVHMHTVMRAALPGNVPPLLDAYTTSYAIGGRQLTLRLGVILMGRVTAILSNLLAPRPGAPHPGQKIEALVSRRLKELCAKLEAAGLVHGDLHTQNLGYRIVDGSPILFMIDFGRSFEGPECDHDRYMIWRDSLFPGRGDEFNRALKATQFPGSEIMRQVVGSDKPPYGTPYEPVVSRSLHFMKKLERAQTKYWRTAHPARIATV